MTKEHLKRLAKSGRPVKYQMFARLPGHPIFSYSNLKPMEIGNEVVKALQLGCTKIAIIRGPQVSQIDRFNILNPPAEEEGEEE